VTSGTDYRDRVAQSFLDIGLDAAVGVAVQGVRNSYEVDVVVRSEQVGFDLVWLVDCTCWNTPVTEANILALSGIVFDINADRGILMAEAGVERGALRVAQLEKVQLASLADVGLTASHALGMARLRSLQERVDHCRERYWNLSKEERTRQGLRSEPPTSGYSGEQVIKATESGLTAAFLGIFPLLFDDLTTTGLPTFVSADTPNELFAGLEPHIADLERRLDAAATSTQP
jgi:restriction system protein